MNLEESITKILNEGLGYSAGISGVVLFNLKTSKPVVDPVSRGNQEKGKWQNTIGYQTITAIAAADGLYASRTGKSLDSLETKVSLELGDALILGKKLLNILNVSVVLVYYGELRSGGMMEIALSSAEQKLRKLSSASE
ncbi:MAG: hypothetical protein HQL07_07910 [Nitrospirae bacterium]|nr:hypothetical protein [Magnetococcales bacterium]